MVSDPSLSAMQWNNGDSIEELLLQVKRFPSDTAFRFFACGVCRQPDLWNRLSDSRSRFAIEIAEQYAKGLVHADRLRQAEQDALDVPGEYAYLAAEVVCERAWGVAWEVAIAAKQLIPETRLCTLLRDVLNNPFNPIRLNPALLKNSAVRTVARVIDATSRYEDMPILGDALEEAGFNEPALLEHCRVSKPHIAGCWVIECCLGRLKRLGRQGAS